MLCCRAHVFRIPKQNLSILRQFSSILRQTQFNSVFNLPVSSFSKPIRTVLPNSLVTSKGFELWGLRSDHTMASQSSNPQSVYDFTVKVRTFAYFDLGFSWNVQFCLFWLIGLERMLFLFVLLVFGVRKLSYVVWFLSFFGFVGG